MTLRRIAVLLFACLVTTVPTTVITRSWAECPEEKPYATSCLKEAPTCVGTSVGCTSRELHLPADGDFGCRSNGENQTECLDGGAKTMAPCYEKHGCHGEGTACVPNPSFQVVAHVQKVIADCPK